MGTIGMALQGSESDDFARFNYILELLPKAFEIIYNRRFKKSNYKKRRSKNYRRRFKWNT